MIPLARTNALVLLLSTSTVALCPHAARAQKVPMAPPAPATPGSIFDVPGAVLPTSTDRAESSPSTRRPGLLQPFGEALADLARLPSWQNATWIAGGLAGAGAAYPADDRISRDFAATRTDSFKPGTIIGGTPFQLGSAFTAYAIGRARNQPRLMALGHDLIEAQVLTEILTQGIKQSVRRVRPDGGNFSFPSGHAAVSFASATVLQRHLGWRAGVPAYAVATYVAASRIQTRRHFLSDVAFGATLGLVAGRTVAIGGGRKLAVTPGAAPGGGSITFTWLGKDAR
jgi:membrane-associated phospholipid phosphatase